MRTTTTILALAASLAGAGCSGGGSPPHFFDLSITFDQASAFDFSVGGEEDMAMGGGEDAGPCALVVNEVQTATIQQASEEFVEIFSPCGHDQDLTGWKIVYRAGTNVKFGEAANDSTTLATILGVTIPPGGYVVFGGAMYLGEKDGSLTGSMAAGAGAVGIREPMGMLIDSVAYGTVDPMNAFIETTAAPAPPVVATPGGSIQRVPDGSDTADNSVDFVALQVATPKAANQ